MSAPVSDLANSEKPRVHVPKSPIKVLQSNFCIRAKVIWLEPLTSWDSKLVRNELSYRAIVRSWQMITCRAEWEPSLWLCRFNLSLSLSLGPFQVNHRWTWLRQELSRIPILIHAVSTFHDLHELTQANFAFETRYLPHENKSHCTINNPRIINWDIISCSQRSHPSSHPPEPTSLETRPSYTVLGPHLIIYSAKYLHSLKRHNPTIQNVRCIRARTSE